MRQRWDDDDDHSLMELARLNIKANIEWDLGLLYSPRDLNVAVVISAPSVVTSQGKRMRARVSIVIEEE
jgi:hypothetical protein